MATTTSNGGENGSKVETLRYAESDKIGPLGSKRSIIDDDRRRHVNGLLASLNMLIETPGGFDYSFAQAKPWLIEAGFQSAELVPLTGAKSMIVARK
jgi:hypothetical protein